MTTIEQLKKTLRGHNYSLTTAGQAVFNALDQKEPQTMAEIVRHTEPRADRASVYRTIALFEQLNIVNRLQIGWKYKLELSDKFMHHHHHLTCLKCGKTISLKEDDKLENSINNLARQNGFIPKDHQLEIRGICPACQNPKV